METPLTPLEFARRARKLYGDREAVVDGDMRLTYEEFFSGCDRWSSALQAMGVGQGDRVAYIAPNTREQLESFYAVPQIGAVLVPINYRLTAEDFVYITSHSGAKVLCVHPDYVEAVEGVRDQLRGVEQFVVLGDAGGRKGWREHDAEVARAEPSFKRVDVKEDDLLSLNYTSGTTAKPKGVMITHRNAWMNVMDTLVHFHLTVDDRYLWTLPMFHANGWTFVWIITAVGGKHICLPKVEPARVFDLIREENVGWLCAAPTVLISLAGASKEVRGEVPGGVHVVTAGAPPAAATIERMEGEFGWEVTQVYGLTETSPFLTICEPRPEHASRSTSERAVIKALTGVEMIGACELRVVDGDGKDVPADGQTLGEIVARGNVIMQGYYNDPEATKKVMGDGWFHTGDAAVMHPDGYAEIRDRIKDVIISGGENISSIEVEGVLLRHPAVAECSVVGRAHPEWGEEVIAFIVADGNVEKGDLDRLCLENIARFKRPKDYRFVDSLPKNNYGKVLKTELRHKLGENGKP